MSVNPSSSFWGRECDSVVVPSVSSGHDGDLVGRRHLPRLSPPGLASGHPDVDGEHEDGDGDGQEEEGKDEDEDDGEGAVVHRGRLVHHQEEDAFAALSAGAGGAAAVDDPLLAVLVLVFADGRRQVDGGRAQPAQGRPGKISV